MSMKLVPTRAGTDSQAQTGVVLKEKLAEPPLFKVLLLNDDFTPMEFVMTVLQRHFQKDVATARALTLRVHHEGSAVCGVYPYDLAETKVALVTEEARAGGHPLLCTLEKA